MKVKFIPQNIECEVKTGQSVLDVALQNNIYIKSICRGVPSCAECRVVLAEGEYNVLQPSSAELSLIGSGYFIDRRRLSCQLKCFGDITVDLTEQIEKETELKSPKPRSRNSREETIQSNAVMGNMMTPVRAPENRPTPTKPVDQQASQTLSKPVNQAPSRPVNQQAVQSPSKPVVKTEDKK